LAAAPTLASAPAKAGAASIQTADTRCANYPGSIYTITNLRLKKHRVERGEGNKAIVHVRSQRGTPKGSIKLSILPVRGSGQEVRLFHKLHNGVATTPSNIISSRLPSAARP